MTPPAKKPEPSDPTLTAGDVKNATGMSYRQLNDWDAKGALPSQRRQDADWRKFTRRQVFAIMVCKEIRDKFGTPLENLRGVSKFILEDGAGHLENAVQLMFFGLAVFILTDLKETFVMDSDLGLLAMLDSGMLRAKEDQAFLLIQVNHLVNRLFACLKMPGAFHISRDNYEVVKSTRLQMVAQSEQEIAVIRAIRQGDYKRVSLTKKNDEDMVLELEQELPESEAATVDVNGLLKEHEFQTVTVSRTNGKNVRVKRTLPVPLRHKHMQRN